MLSKLLWTPWYITIGINVRIDSGIFLSSSLNLLLARERAGLGTNLIDLDGPNNVPASVKTLNDLMP